MAQRALSQTHCSLGVDHSLAASDPRETYYCREVSYGIYLYMYGGAWDIDGILSMYKAAGVITRHHRTHIK